MAPLNDWDLAIVRGRLVTPGGVIAGGVAIKDGRIVRLGTGDEITARRVLDAGGRYVLPGLVDSHVHFRTPGLVHKEDWVHGSRAAVAGGVTTVIDMPNTVPPLLTGADAHAKHRLVAGCALVDYRFHAGVDPVRPHLLKEFTDQEAVSAKVFMTGHHTAHQVATADQLDEIFATAAGTGLRLVVHAEAGELFALLDRWRPLDRSLDFDLSRPRSGAIVAAARVIELVRRHGTSTHLVHVSTAEETDLLTAAVHDGLPITFEVTPHHLSFTREDVRRHGTRLRLSPAIRTEHDRARLWAAVLDGDAATLGSDHAPHTLEEKHRPIAEAPPGMPGVQEMLPAVFTGMARQRPAESHDDRLLRIARLLADNPARLFGLGGAKGRLAPGFDADLVLFDPDVTWSFGADMVAAKCGWSPYEGWMFTGRVETTIRRGDLVFDRTGDAGGPAYGARDGAWLDAVRRSAVAGRVR